MDGTFEGLQRALRLNAEGRAGAFAGAASAGAMWLVECRDLWDASDEDAGVFYQPCADDAGVDRLLAEYADGEWHSVLGIYDVRRPLEAQGPGLRPESWRRGERPSSL